MENFGISVLHQIESNFMYVYNSARIDIMRFADSQLEKRYSCRW